MTEALVVRASNVAQHPQLAAGKQAVRNRDPQHWCEALSVETVTQTQRAKLVVRNLAGEKPLSLIAILCDAFVDKLLIVGVVLVHGGYRRGGDRKRVGEGKSVTVRVDVGGRRSVKKKKK